MPGKMKGKVCLITGATSGIGKAAAIELADLGATVIGVGRDKVRCAEVEKEILNSTGNMSAEFLLSDLSDQEQVRELAREFMFKYERLDVLINNAGAFFLWRKINSQGIEMTWALNHLNYFLLTNLLLEQILASAPARIVNVASGSHYRGKIHFDDPNLEKGYNGWKAYCQSKLANVLFTYELVRRLGDRRVTVNALSPGFVATRIGHNTGPVLKYLVNFVQKLGGKKSEEGAETITYLASSPEVAQITGKFFRDKVAVKSSPISYDQEIARRLWEISELMTGSNE